MEGPVPPPVSVRAEMEERRIQLQAGKAQLPICPQRKVGSETRKPPRQPSQKSIVESPHVGSRLSGQGQPAALARNSADVGPHIDNADAWNEQALDVPAESRIESSTSEERRVGKECVSTCSSRWCQYH